MATQPIDYAALAKQYGAIASTPAPAAAVAPNTPVAPADIDYAGLAKQFGAIASAPAGQTPRFTPEHYRQAQESVTSRVLDSDGNPLPEQGSWGQGILDTLRKTADKMNVENVLRRIGNADDLAGQGRWAEAWSEIRDLLPGGSPSGQVLGNQQGTTFDEQKAFARDTYDKAKTGDYSGAASNVLMAALGNAEHAAPLAEAAKPLVNKTAQAVSDAASKTADAIGQANIPGRARAFAARPSTLENFSDAFAAVPSQRPALTQAMDTFQRMGISPAKNIEDMSAAVEDARSKLSNVYETLIPFVENRQIPAQDVISGLEQEKAGYARKGVVSASNQPFVDKIDKEIETAQNLAAQNGNGRLDFNDVRYLRDGMNGRTDFKSPQAEENFYRSVGDVYRGALDQMAPETTGINRDWANLDNAKFIADKNLAMGRGVVPSGLDKLFQPKMGARLLGSATGTVAGGLVGTVVGGVLPDAATATYNFAKSLPDRIRAAKDYTPPVEYPNPAVEPRPEPAGLLEAAPVRMPGAADTSGPVKGAPYMGRGVSPEVGNRMLPPASRIQTPGFAAAGDDLVPVKDPSTGQYVYVPRWTLQENASPVATTPDAAPAPATTGLAEEAGSAAESEHDGGNGADPDSAQQPRGARLVHQSGQPGGQRGLGEAAGTGRRLSGAEIEADRLMAEAKAKKAQREAQRQPLGEMARVPELPGKRDETFTDGQTTRFHIGRARFDPFEPGQEDADVIPYTSAHVANVHLMEFLGRVAGRPLDDAGANVGAFRFGPEQLEKIATGIEHHANAFGAGSTPIVQKLQKAISEAEDAGRSAVFVKDNASMPAGLKESLFDQELNHVRQGLLGPAAEHLGASAESFVESPLGKKAKAALEQRLEYSFGKNYHVAALEIGERLMRPGAYRELGLSEAERDVLAEQYMQSLEKEYGKNAQNVIARVRRGNGTAP